MAADLKSTEINSTKQPSSIQVPKPKWRPKTPCQYKDIIKDNMEGYEYLEQFVHKCTTIRRHKQQYSSPTPDPSFKYIYTDAKDKTALTKNLILADCPPNLRPRVISFVKEFWDVFREEGVSIPIRGYEMVIDTGSHTPVKVPLPHYGLHEAQIMQKTIDELIRLKHIKPDTTSPWGFRITLAPKPHQEKITDINDFVWRFCINYIQLNKITRSAEYPIPRCDDAVMNGLGAAIFFILLDAFQAITK